VFGPLLAFFAIKGVGNPFASDNEALPQGINTSLPDAKLEKQEPVSKLGFYERAGKDTSDVSGVGLREPGAGFNLSGHAVDPQADRINQRLAALNQELARPATQSNSAPANERFGQVQSVNMKSDVDRLEMLMKSMQDKNGEDPEMQQLGGMLQQIIDIQHPELLKERLSKRGADNGRPDSLFKAIPAIVVNKGKVVHGASVELCLQDSVRLNGMMIPKGHKVFGVCRVMNQRLLVDIKNVRLGNSIIPASLSVYSLDGMEGLNAPEAMLTDALNGGTMDASSSIGLSGFDQSLVTQVAGAGIDAAKGLLSKKLRRVKVCLKAGEKVLLRNLSLRAR
jgi:hypothetical protein